MIIKELLSGDGIRIKGWHIRPQEPILKEEEPINGWEQHSAIGTKIHFELEITHVASGDTSTVVVILADA